jgi:hypothetical protein
MNLCQKCNNPTYLCICNQFKCNTCGKNGSQCICKGITFTTASGSAAHNHTLISYSSGSASSGISSATANLKYANGLTGTSAGNIYGGSCSSCGQPFGLCQCAYSAPGIYKQPAIQYTCRSCGTSPCSCWSQAQHSHTFVWPGTSFTTAERIKAFRLHDGVNDVVLKSSDEFQIDERQVADGFKASLTSLFLPARYKMYFLYLGKDASKDQYYILAPLLLKLVLLQKEDDQETEKAHFVLATDITGVANQTGDELLVTGLKLHEVTNNLKLLKLVNQARLFREQNNLE